MPPILPVKDILRQRRHKSPVDFMTKLMPPVGGAPAALDEATMFMDHTSMVAVGGVFSKWTNLGSLGASYDFDQLTYQANLVLESTNNSLPCWDVTDRALVQTAAERTLTGDATQFVVHSNTREATALSIAASGIANPNRFAIGRNGSGTNGYPYATNGGGFSIPVTSVLDNSMRVHCSQFQRGGLSNSRYSVSGYGSATGILNDTDTASGSIFAHYGSPTGIWTTGKFQAFVLIERYLSDAEVTEVMDYFAALYGTS